MSLTTPFRLKSIIDGRSGSSLGGLVRIQQLYEGIYSFTGATGPTGSPGSASNTGSTGYTGPTGSFYTGTKNIIISNVTGGSSTVPVGSTVLNNIAIGVGSMVNSASGSEM